MAKLFRITESAGPAPTWDEVEGNWDDVPGTFDEATGGTGTAAPHPKLFRTEAS